jgi:anti-anti-sigma factor
LTTGSRHGLPSEPGDILVTAEGFHQTIKELLAENRRKLALNFKNVQRADSFGMGSLAASFASVERNDGVVKVFSPSKDVHAAMQEIHLDQVIETFSREKDALSSFAN